MRDSLTVILEGCKRGERPAQKRLYELYKDKMYVLCLRYANSREDAQDMMQEGFVKVFRDLHQFKGLGSFEGWVRKVMLNVALQHLKQQKKLRFEMDYVQWEHTIHAEEEEEFDEELVKTILKIMHKMPTGFRTVLNLYVLEGFSHQQIAEELGISVGTSKSQLNRAKEHLRKLVDKSLTR